MKLTPTEAARLFDVTPEPTGLVVSFQKCLRDFELLRARREELCRSLMHSFRLIGATQVMASHCALRVTCDDRSAQRWCTPYGRPWRATSSVLRPEEALNRRAAKSAQSPRG